MLAVNSTNTITLTGLHDATDFVNDADVAASLLDSAGTEVVALTLDYVNASDGDYTGVLDSTTDLTAQELYTLRITAVTTSGQQVFQQRELADYIEV